MCTAGMDTLSAMELQKDMLTKTEMVVRWVKRSMLTVSMEISGVESHIGGVKAACGCFARS